MDAFFRDFVERRLPAGDVDLLARVGGSGPATVLLHGHPRTSATWWRVAPVLAAAGRTVVCLDLPGYGRSGQPALSRDHANHSKRRHAERILRAVNALGVDRFDLVGHDRGGYTAFRLAMDHPGAVRRLAVADVVPIAEHLGRADARFAEAWWHWFFFAQPDLPERAIGADPDGWYRLDRERMGAMSHRETQEALRRPEVVRAMLEDYRAGLHVDRADDEADRAAGRRLAVPLLVLWSARDDLEALVGDPVGVWREWACRVEGRSVECGHHMAEEAPDALAAALLDFLDP